MFYICLTELRLSRGAFHTCTLLLSANINYLLASLLWVAFWETCKSFASIAIHELLTESEKNPYFLRLNNQVNRT